MLSLTLRPWTDRLRTSPSGIRCIRAVADAQGSGRIPRGVEIKVVHADGLDGRWVSAAGGSGGRGVLLYVHGGGYVFGSFRSHWPLVRRLQKETGFDVFFVDYRRAPEHPYPAASVDVLAAYRYLLGEGVDPATLVIAGDSVGCQLISGLMIDLGRHRLPGPAALLMISPALDLTGKEAQRRDAQRRDPMLSPPYGLRLARVYLDGQAIDIPQLSVIDAPKTGWPPVLITAGGTECMLGDAEAMAASLRAYGVECELQVWPGQVHVFQAFEILPEARASLSRAAAFLRSRSAVGTARAGVHDR